MSGLLYVVATPIGNLEDMTYRAVRILAEVDLIAAEDTRHSRRLLDHYGIKTRLISCHEHNEKERSIELIQRLQTGENVALISDAGTPAIADPGYRLVRACRLAGVEVACVPGCNALIAGLSISGLPTDNFRFAGFLPSKKTARQKLISDLCSVDHTLVFYETPHRLLAALEDLCHICGAGREVAIGRELTKKHEELFFGTLLEASEYFAQKTVKGELVLMLAAAANEAPIETIEAALQRLHAEGELTWKEIVKRVAKEHGLPGSEVYARSLPFRS
ncbi:16S rRNA (cytidine(1402)-2'-O)-methyltransferase [Geopsychrobacter electrodiphilus]|uniref:16S rRNA (cytidine(1402)-2'-O)-methyltransferase n=1 Tax=Geopsychrobacter electrodiphilus TaxID=225196 RepID=UPI000379D75F|nr:16S rRNA (cytidine(1402)-2'-O)-methyltransferase [Geopsychrobacter electrodiphilus]